MGGFSSNDHDYKGYGDIYSKINISSNSTYVSSNSLSINTSKSASVDTETVDLGTTKKMSATASTEPSTVPPTENPSEASSTKPSESASTGSNDKAISYNSIAVPRDYDGDGVLSESDVKFLQKQLNEKKYDSSYDLDGVDGFTLKDISILQKKIADKSAFSKVVVDDTNSYMDFNNDGIIDSADAEEFSLLSSRYNIQLDKNPVTEYLNNHNLNENYVDAVMKEFGDFNSDGVVDVTDVTELKKYLDNEDVVDYRYDFDGDGVVTSEDVNILNKYISKEDVSNLLDASKVEIGKTRIKLKSIEFNSKAAKEFYDSFEKLVDITPEEPGYPVDDQGNVVGRSETGNKDYYKKLQAACLKYYNTLGSEYSKEKNNLFTNTENMIKASTEYKNNISVKNDFQTELDRINDLTSRMKEWIEARDYVKEWSGNAGGSPDIKQNLKTYGEILQKTFTSAEREQLKKDYDTEDPDEIYEKLRNIQASLNYSVKELEKSEKLMVYDFMLDSKDFEDWSLKHTNDDIFNIGQGSDKYQKSYTGLTWNQKVTYTYLYEVYGQSRADAFLDILQDDINRAQGMIEADKFIDQYDKNVDKIIKSDGTLMDDDDIAACTKLINDKKYDKQYDMDENGKLDDKDLEKLEQYVETGGELKTTFKNLGISLDGGVADGFKKFFAGLGYIFDDTRQLSVDEYKVMFIAQKLQQNKALSLSYEFGTTVGNMLPVIAAAAVATALSAPAGGSGGAVVAIGGIELTAGQATAMAMIAASTYGNSKHEALCNGYALEQAIGYGILCGASESVLDVYLGTLPFIGQESGYLLKDMVKNGAQEAIQEVSSAVIGQIMLGEDIDISQMGKDSSKAFVFGFLMSGMFSGAGKVYNNVNVVLDGVRYQLSPSQIMEYYKNGFETDPETGNRVAKMSLKDFILKNFDTSTKPNLLYETAMEASDLNGVKSVFDSTELDSEISKLSKTKKIRLYEKLKSVGYFDADFTPTQEQFINNTAVFLSPKTQQIISSKVSLYKSSIVTESQIDSAAQFLVDNGIFPDKKSAENFCNNYATINIDWSNKSSFDVDKFAADIVSKNPGFSVQDVKDALEVSDSVIDASCLDFSKAIKKGIMSDLAKVKNPVKYLELISDSSYLGKDALIKKYGFLDSKGYYSATFEDIVATDFYQQYVNDVIGADYVKQFKKTMLGGKSEGDVFCVQNDVGRSYTLNKETLSKGSLGRSEGTYMFSAESMIAALNKATPDSVQIKTIEDVEAVLSGKIKTNIDYATLNTLLDLPANYLNNGGGIVRSHVTEGDLRVSCLIDNGANSRYTPGMHTAHNVPEIVARQKTDLTFTHDAGSPVYVDKGNGVTFYELPKK